jgi:uncharacterized membrane protein
VSRWQAMGFKLFLVGFLLVFVGVVLLAVSSFFSESDTSSCIIILIGPIPIVIGSGPDALVAMFIAGILMVFSLVLFVFMRRRVG